MSLSVDHVLDGKYRIVRIIGEGGMGTVFEGENIRIKRKVAIKTLLPAKNNEEIVLRFEHEAQAAGRIGNDHILEVLDLGTLPTGEHYMVLEYLDGHTLAQRIDSRGALPGEDVALIVQQVLVALVAAHGAGIIHRDLKPHNIFVLPQKHGIKDFVKLIDFGISKFRSVDGEASHVTKVGSLLGTPSYLSPELARGNAEADERTDIYGLGVIMYEAVSRQLPFVSQNFNELLFKIVEEAPVHIRQHAPDLDPELANMIMRAMARSPADRFPSATAFLEALTSWMTARNIVPRAASMASVPNMMAATPSGSQPHPFVGKSPPGATVRLPGSQVGPQKTEVVGGAPAPGNMTAPLPGGPTGDSVAQPWAASQGQVPKKRLNYGWFAAVALVALLLGVGLFAKVKSGASDPALGTPATAPVKTEQKPPEPTPPAEPTPAATAPSTPPPVDTPPSAASATPAAPAAPATVARPNPTPRSAATPTSSGPAPTKPKKPSDDEIPTMR